MSHLGTGAQAPRPSSTVFPGALAGIWIGSRATRPPTGTQMACRNCSQRLTYYTTVLVLRAWLFQMEQPQHDFRRSRSSSFIFLWPLKRSALFSKSDWSWAPITCQQIVGLTVQVVQPFWHLDDLQTVPCNEKECCCIWYISCFVDFSTNVGQSDELPYRETSHLSLYFSHVWNAYSSTTWSQNWVW